jgi:hypothetical protein
MAPAPCKRTALPRSTEAQGGDEVTLARAISAETLALVGARFWACVDRRAADECWPWLGTLTPAGYGRIKVGKRPLLASRISLLLAGHDLAPDQFACHRCDNPPCVNPAHLFVGAPLDNVTDMYAKGRRDQRGANNPRSKLTVEQVREIRARAGSTRQIAREFGVGPTAIRNIKSGKRWRHVQ